MSIRLTPAVKALLISCFAAFIIQQTADQFLGMNLLAWLGLIPSGVVLEHRFWQLITYAFLHGDVMHLFLNMMMLAFIGGELENAWGTARFLRFYAACAVSAGILYLALQLLGKDGGLQAPMVGASGAIYGLLMAYGLLFGERVLLFMMLFPMKAKYFVWVLVGVEFMSTVFSGRGGLASAAHLGGMVTGFCLLWGRAAWTVAKKNRQHRGATGKAKKRAASNHLRLVINNEPAPGPETDDPDEHPKTWH